MAIINPNALISDLGIKIEAITKAYSSLGYQEVVEVIRGPLESACILYIILRGLALVFGLINEPVKEFAKSALRMGLIFTFAMNWGYFSGYFVDLLKSSSETLGTALLQINPLGDIFATKHDLMRGLQSVLTEVVKVGNHLWGLGGMLHPGPYVTGFIIWISGIGVVGLAFFEIVVANILLSILFCLAPFFILLTLFERTRGYFDQWVGRCVGYSLVMVFVSAVVGLTLSLIHWSIPITPSGQVEKIRMVGWVPILFCSVLCIKAILEASDMAKSIGGSFSSGSGSAMVGGLVGSAIGLGASSKAFSQKSMSAAGKGVFGAMRGAAFFGSDGYRQKAISRATQAIRKFTHKF